ncbi:MAG: hypothetical protein MPJ78_02780 [Hyphomicrobiaceae bacterium]|nr:hypothetical protein [Hyphomicrobiaceae bacterium]
MARESKPKPKRGASATKSSAQKPAAAENEADSGEPVSASSKDPSPPVEDTELLEMLEHLSKTIDTAHSVLDEQHRMVMEATQPPVPHLPGVEPVQSVAEPPGSRSGPVIAIVTAAISAILAIGALGIWWLFLNQPKSTAWLQTGKDESRISGAGTTPDGGPPLDPEPPLPKKNPGRHIVAEVAAVPVQKRAPSASSSGGLRPTKVIDPMPYEPVDVRHRAGQRTASLSAPPPQPVVPRPRVKEKVPPIPAPRVVSQEPPTPRQNAAPAQRPPQPQPVVTPLQPALPPRVEKPALSRPESRPEAPARTVKQGSSGKQTNPTRVARIPPQKPATSGKSAPRKKAPPPLSAEQERRILERGANLAQLGDIAGARLVLEYAALRGSSQAMFALGQMFDPEYLAARGVIGVAPDVRVALNWYRQAAKLGVDAASARAREMEAKYGQNGQMR